MSHGWRSVHAVHFACQLDDDFGLTGGLHTFYVRGIDTLGNVSADKTQRWTVDLANHSLMGGSATGASTRATMSTTPLR